MNQPEAVPSTEYFIPGSGIISSRSGWGSDATHFTFLAGPTTQSHQDRNQGAFTLFRNDWLAATAKLQSHSGLDQDAIDHCCVTVDSKPQTWTQAGVSILRQEQTPAYTYAMANLADAYNNQLSAFIREVFFLKPTSPTGSAFVIIADGYVPVNPASAVTFHLNTPNQPKVTGGIFQAGSLFGTVIEPGVLNISTQTVKLAPDQAIPTYRIDIQGDGSGHFLVALEAGPAGQSMGTTGPPVATRDVQGIRCGSSFVGWLTGGQATWSYVSPVVGLHCLIGTPNTQYQTPSGPITSTACGILIFGGQAVGQTVTITKGATPPPPPPPPVVKTYTATGQMTLQPDGSLVGLVTLEPNG